MNLLHSIVASDWFTIGVIVWCIIALANRDKRQQALDTVSELIIKPIIFQNDSNPGSVKLYPRQSLETIARILTSGVFGVSNRIINVAGIWRKHIENRFSADESSFWKMMGSVIFFFAMGAFFYADLIAIFNTLDILGLLVTSIPPAFRHYEFGVVFGSFFTIVLAGLLLMEIFGKPIFTESANQPGPVKLLLTWISVFLVISGLSVAISLGLIRYGALTSFGPISNSPLNNLTYLILTILVPANTIISTLLIVSEGLKGIPVIGFLIVQILISCAVVILFVFGLINYPLWFGFDIVYRVVLSNLYLIFFFILTPLDSILSWKPFTKEEPKHSSDTTTPTKNKQT
jgi:hypothetical protein